MREEGRGSFSGWKLQSRRWLVQQFGRPVGLWGGVAGQIMARRSSNIERNLWTVELLEIQATDRVLEIGFGPGVGIAAAARLATAGIVEGIDHSEVMLRQATRRNRAAIESGRVRLRSGSVSDLSRAAGCYQKIFAVNSVAFWPDPVEGLSKLRDLVALDGVLALTEQPRLQSDAEQAARRSGERLESQLVQAGFGRVVVDRRQVKGGLVVCARAWIT